MKKSQSSYRMSLHSPRATEKQRPLATPAENQEKRGFHNEEWAMCILRYCRPTYCMCHVSSPMLVRVIIFNVRNVLCTPTNTFPVPCLYSSLASVQTLLSELSVTADSVFSPTAAHHFRNT